MDAVHPVSDLWQPDDPFAMCSALLSWLVSKLFAKIIEKTMEACMRKAKQVIGFFGIIMISGMSLVGALLEKSRDVEPLQMGLSQSVARLTREGSITSSLRQFHFGSVDNAES